MDFNAGDLYIAVMHTEDEMTILFDSLKSKGLSIAVYDMTGTISSFQDVKLIRDTKVPKPEQCYSALDALAKQYDVIYIAGIDLISLNWAYMSKDKHKKNIIFWEAFDTEQKEHGIFNVNTFEFIPSEYI